MWVRGFIAANLCLFCVLFLPFKLLAVLDWQLDLDIRRICGARRSCEFIIDWSHVITFIYRHWLLLDTSFFPCSLKKTWTPFSYWRPDSKFAIFPFIITSIIYSAFLIVAVCRNGSFLYEDLGFNSQRGTQTFSFSNARNKTAKFFSFFRRHVSRFFLFSSSTFWYSSWSLKRWPH